MRNLLRTPLALIASCGFNILGAETDERPAKGIQDNSFLVEEAYNQEAGVVQHIFTVGYGLNRNPQLDDHEWEFAFTQEWPFLSQTHQLSYTVPFAYLESGGRSVSGIADVLLNYRLQALYETDSQPAFAPRISLVLPTGSRNKGLGNHRLGYQFNLPVSKIVHPRWTLNANAGLTFFPHIRERNPVTYSVGASVIYAVSPNFNLMLESVGDWTEDVAADRSMERDFEAVISPGARYAFNLESGAQLVLGIAAPIGLTRATPDYGVIFYLSFEHRFLREK
jgi:hypothetical protein